MRITTIQQQWDDFKDHALTGATPGELHEIQKVFYAGYFSALRTFKLEITQIPDDDEGAREMQKLYDEGREFLEKLFV